MKILVCIPCLLTGGTEIQTLNLVQALSDGGHKVITACYFEYQDEMVSKFKETGCEVVCMNPTGDRISGWKGIIFLFNRLREVVHQFKPDVAHVQYMAPGAIPILILKLLGVKNIIATSHTFGDIYKNLSVIKFLQGHILRTFTCITESAEKSYFGTSELYTESYSLKKRNHFTIYNSLPKTFTISQKTRNFHNNPIVIGVVSRLEKIKGMDLVIPAFKKILSYDSDTKLIIVGDGSLKEEMYNKANELQCENRITWAGRQPQNELAKWYDKMDIVLMPSRSEGFGLTAIEAMAHGCVVVAANTGGLPEVVQNNKVGLLHKPESVEDIADKVLSLIKDRKKLSSMSENCYEYVNRFRFIGYSKLFNNLYSKLK